MPHCILETSDNIVEKPSRKEVLLKINESLAETGLFNINDIKSRWLVHHDYCIGDGDNQRAFATLNIAILEGRSQEIKNLISDKLLKMLHGIFKESLTKLKFSLTIQITDMNKDSYARERSY